MKRPVTRYRRHRFPPQIIQHAVWLYQPLYARRLRRRHPGYGDTFFMDEVFVGIRGEQRYLWRAVDQDGEVVDVLFQERRDAAAAKRLFGCLLARHAGEPRTIVSDKLGSYAAARREVIPEAMHDTARYANNRVELSHQTTRVPERGMRRFKSMLQAQRFLRVHAAVSNLFNLGRHLVAADHYRELRRSAFASWGGAVAV
jgi:putative transposase